MTDGSQFLQVAAGIDFDSIAPFIFVILIVVSQILGALKKKNAKESEEEPDVDAHERARQIREEIRRKIEERRQEMESGKPRSASRSRPVEYDPTKPDGQPRVPQRPASRPSQPAQRKTSPAEPVYTPPGSSQPSLEEQLAKQRERLKEAQRKQQEARARAREMLEETGVEMRTRQEQAWEVRTNAGDFRKQLIGDLRNRDGLKTAVLLREILGKPMGLR